MDPTEESKTAPKHEHLKENINKDEIQEVEAIETKKIENVVSPFIANSKDWEDEETFKISKELRENIVANLKFAQPSMIQSKAVPLIMNEPHQNVIVMAPNGSGKTGAFSIGATGRVDPTINEIQIVVLTNSRELCNQVANVFELLTKGTTITVQNFAHARKKAHIVVTTPGAFLQTIGQRGAPSIKKIRCVVIDEADEFMKEDKGFEDIKKIKNKLSEVNFQWILFSATFKKEYLDNQVYQLMEKAQIIKLESKKIAEKLQHIKQYHLKCEPKKKLDFIMDVFETCAMTQTFIFVNTKDFAEIIHKKLRKNGLASYIMFGKMTKEERDDTMQKFRDQQINVLITTNIIARGIDVPQVELVINYDVPTQKVNGKPVEDVEQYQHRIGRCGRFGKPGIALSIWDRDIDKQLLDNIVSHYEGGMKLEELKGADHLKDLLEEIQASQS